MANVTDHRLLQALEAEADRQPNTTSAPRSDYQQAIHDLLRLAGIFTPDDAAFASDGAHLFVRSLAAHARDQAALAVDWRAANGDRSPEKLLGADLVRQLERFRMRGQSDPTPAREVTAVLAIIKNWQSEYLLQFDAAAQLFQLIGGKVEDDDQSWEEALRREIREELGGRINLTQLNL